MYFKFISYLGYNMDMLLEFFAYFLGSYYFVSLQQILPELQDVEKISLE